MIHMGMKNIKSWEEALREGELPDIAVHQTFHGLDLSGRDLSGRNLYKTKLINCDLSDSVLRGAELERATLNNSSFRGADLTRANMRNCSIFKTDFTDADLTGVDGLESSVYLMDAKFMRTNLKALPPEFFERVSRESDDPLGFLEDCYGIPDGIKEKWLRKRRAKSAFGM